MVESVAYKGELFPLFLSAMSLNAPTTPEVSVVTPSREFVLMGSIILLNCSPISKFQTVSDSVLRIILCVRRRLLTGKQVEQNHGIV